MNRIIAHKTYSNINNKFLRHPYSTNDIINEKCLTKQESNLKSLVKF